MLTRRLLLGSLAAGGALLAGGRASAAGPNAGGDPGNEHVAVRLGYVGTPCEAVTFAAPGGEPFRRHGLAAKLVPCADDAALAAALEAGRVDAASMNLPALMEPLEAGTGIRVVAGLHAGCLRVVAPEDFVLRTFGNLKGASIATDRLNGPSMKLLSALLRRQGVDPKSDVSWHVYDPAALEPALDAKTVDCVAAQDPLGYALLADKKAVAFLNTADGGFTCGDGIGRGHHCFLALHAGLVDRRPQIAAALTRAYVESSNAVGRGVGPWALAEVRGRYVDADMFETIGMLSSYDWHASTDLVLEEIELTARDFRRAGLLKAATDPERLADRAFADVLHS
jgi:NitT/TauT family transport system substrate-binding protein